MRKLKTGRTSSICWFAHSSGPAWRNRNSSYAAPAEVTEPAFREKSQRSLEEIVNAYYIHRRWQAHSRGKSIVVGAAAAVAWLLGFCAAPPSNANIVITDGNSAVTIDPTSSAGVEQWTINGQNQIHQEWFWIRTGSTGGQSSIDTLSAPTITSTPSDMAELTYGSSNGLQIEVEYSLTGGLAGSETSDLGETIVISNNGTSSQTYHFFEYANFNLGDSTSGQTETISVGPGGTTATDVGNGWQDETVVSLASEYEANDYPTLLDEIASSTSYTLSGASTSTKGDGEWAFEWDMTIGAKSSYVISGDDNIIPEPVSGLIAVFGLSGLGLMRSRRQNASSC
jgi:hypothetical protein